MNITDIITDKETLLSRVKQEGSGFLHFASEELKNDKDVVREVVKLNGGALVWAAEELRNDKDVVLEAVKKNGMGFKICFRRTSK